VDQAQAAEAAGAAAQAADVRQDELVGVADDDLFDASLAREENADLAPQITRRLGQVTGELGGDDVVGGDPPAKGPFERPPLGGLDAAGVAFDLLRDGSPLLLGCPSLPGRMWRRIVCTQ